MSYEIPTSTEASGFKPVLITPADQYYELEFQEVKDMKKPGKYGPKAVFLFNVIGKNVTLAVTAYKRPATKENMMGNVFTALGIPIDGSSVDLTQHYGKRCKGLIENISKEITGQDGKTDQVVVSVISKIKPLE